jgi:hypothetical protein
MRLRAESAVREEHQHVLSMIDHLTKKASRDHLDDVILSQYESQERELREELAIVQEAGLKVVLDGRGVDGHSIALDRLAEFVDPLNRSIRGVAASDVRSNGATFDADARSLSTGYLRTLFDGSVGLTIVAPAGPPAGEQLEFLRPTLFERSVETVVRILKSVERDNIEENVLDLAGDLDADAVSALRRLAGAMESANAPTRFSWKPTNGGETINTTVLPGQAAALHEVLNAVEPRTETMVVTGDLVGQDLNDGSFHVFADDGSEYRGSVAHGVLTKVRNIGLGHRVNATLEVTYLEGQLRRRSRPRYVLVDADPA